TSVLRAHPSSRSRPRRRRAAAGLAALAALVLAVLPTTPAHAAPEADAVAAAPAPANGFSQQVLFKAAQEKGYSCFRIPAIVKSTRGTLLAFAEGRVHDCGDAGNIDLVVKRSTDGGLTWGPLQIINHGDGNTHGNPA